MELLVVTDQETERFYIKKRMEIFSNLIQLTFTESIIGSVRQLHTNSFAAFIIFMDIHSFSAEEFLPLVKKVNSEMPIICMNRKPNFPQLQSLVRIGIYDYIVFPKENAQLEADIQKLLSNFLKSSTPLLFSPSIQKAIEIIQSNYQEKLTLDVVAGSIFLSPHYFSTLFKKETGDNFSTYLMKYRLDIAKNLLVTTQINVGFIGKLVGIPNAAYFNALFKEYTKKTPLSFRKESNSSHVITKK